MTREYRPTEKYAALFEQWKEKRFDQVWFKSLSPDEMEIVISWQVIYAYAWEQAREF